MTTKPGLIGRTLNHLSHVWRELGQGSVCPSDLKFSPELPEEQRPCLIEQMRSCLEAKGGDVAARLGAARLGNAYMELNDQGRYQFLKLLAEHFDIEQQTLNQTLEDYQNAQGAPQRRRLRRRLKQQLDAPRKQLLTQFNALPEGIKFLVDMRADLRRLRSGDDQLLHDLEQDLKELLVAWFDVGFLKLQQITWDSPASLLEKLIRYEAVHEIRDWNDLKHRLTWDRRLFAFFHPNMPDEPLIFIQVALLQGLATNIHQVLDDDQPPLDPQRADTAIFYSISNAQQGLAGISFGNFLIKRVVSLLGHEFSELQCFATLSPIPGFRRWLASTVNLHSHALVSDREWQMLKQQVPEQQEQPLEYLLNSPQWPQDKALCQLLEPLLMRLCAHYLLREKRRGHQCLDPVSHFHLSNGARIERLNWLADRSDKGLQRSAGLMVNYLYDLDAIESNSERYNAEGFIAATEGLERLIHPR